ncbi:MAG: hypothetical protein JSS27_12025 [Planctomycetes bacterium]|nr:hypothetical protein [Planctomycetota bacterium]
MDFEIQRCSRVCAVTGRALADGEAIVSALVREAGDLKRVDYAASAWPGPTPEMVSWWRSHVPSREARAQRMAPSDLLLQLFDDLESQPDQRPLRYVLTLLLLRRRVFRLEESVELGKSQGDPPEREQLTVYCGRREATYQVDVAVPDAAQVAALQQRWSELIGRPIDK